MDWVSVDYSKKNDESACVIIGIIPEIFEIYVLDYYIGRITQKEILCNMFEKHDKEFNKG